MQANFLSPQALNKAFLKVKPNRSSIERFKSHFNQLLEWIDLEEHEEHLKNDVSDFLKNTWYSPDYYINTKGRTDLVIHTGREGKSPVGVIIETKKPANKGEMLTKAGWVKEFSCFLHQRIWLLRHPVHRAY